MESPAEAMDWAALQRAVLARPVLLSAGQPGAPVCSKPAPMARFLVP